MYNFRSICCLGGALALCAHSASLYAAPGDTLFSDDFERGVLAPWTTSNAAASGILAGAQVSNSPTRGGYTRNTAVTVTSPVIALGGVPSAEVSVWVRRGSDAISEDPDNNEDLVFEYRRSDGSWATLNRWVGEGTPGQSYQETFLLPPDGLHGNFAVRFRQTGGNGFDWDYWHFDDVTVTERAAPPPLVMDSCDDFEAGIAGNWTTNTPSGFAGINSTTFSSPDTSLFTNGGLVEVSSLPIDATDPNFSDISIWLQRGSDLFSEDPDTGEDMIIEYQNDIGAWVNLGTFAGNGAPGQVYNLSYTLPTAGRHANLRLRFRQTGGSGAPYDFWHIDDVCFNIQPLPDLQFTKSAQTISDPVTGTSNPFDIPGAIVRYTIDVTNQGPGTVDSGTLIITDVLQSDLALFVDTSGGDPIVFIDGAVPSGLSYNYATNVSYSSEPDGGPPYSYLPSPDGAGFDANVTGIRIAPNGSMNAAGGGANPSFQLLLEVRVE